MADDGSGADITIPSFLLYKPDADAIKAKLRETDFVQVGRSWSCVYFEGMWGKTWRDAVGRSKAKSVPT